MQTHVASSKKRRPRPDSPLTAGAVAQLVGCHPVTVRRAIDRGDLHAVRLGPRGTFRIDRAAIEAWLRPAGGEEAGVLWPQRSRLGRFRRHAAGGAGGICPHRPLRMAPMNPDPLSHAHDSRVSKPQHRRRTRDTGGEPSAADEPAAPSIADQRAAHLRSTSTSGDGAAAAVMPASCCVPESLQKSAMCFPVLTPTRTRCSGAVADDTMSGLTDAPRRRWCNDPGDDAPARGPHNVSQPPPAAARAGSTSAAAPPSPRSSPPAKRPAVAGRTDPRRGGVASRPL